VTETLACFPPGQAKDLSAPLYINRLDDGPSAEPDITEAETFVFLALTIQKGHGRR